MDHLLILIVLLLIASSFITLYKVYNVFLLQVFFFIVIRKASYKKGFLIVSSNYI